MAAKIKGLQQWCRRMTDGYQDVSINNFTTSWRNGLAFCALIHRFRPDLIDYDSLSPDNVFDNNKLAFEVAERELDIPAFLEAEDMARLKVPDKLSVITYVSQYYNFLNALPQLGGPNVKGPVSPSKTSSGTKRPPDSDISLGPSVKKQPVVDSVSKAGLKGTNQDGKPASSQTLGDKCSMCQNKVYLMERHMDGGKLYHRSCFRHSELSPTNKVFTRSPFLSPSLSAADGQPKSPQSGQTPASRYAGNHSKDLLQKQLHSPRGKTGGGFGDGLGTKHSLGEPDREDSKKSKLQGVLKSSLGEDNRNYSSSQSREQSGDVGLPLSGKEANKLEKRRQEILSSEKTSAESTTKRNVPLIFQQKVKEEEKAAPSRKTDPVAVSKPQDKKMVSSSDSNLRTNKEVSTISDKQQDNKKLGLHKSVGLPSVQSLQEKFSNSRSAEPKEPPVARPRSGLFKIDSNSSNSSDSVLRAKTSESVPSPTPAPRKSMVDPGAKRTLPERPKSPPHRKSLASSQSSSGGSTPRSPPPLPNSPPPALPTSPPPPLPSNNPVGKVKDASGASKPASGVTLPSKKNDSSMKTPDKKSDHKLNNDYLQARSKLNPIAETSTQGQDTKDISGKGSEVITHGPVKSKVLKNDAVSSTVSFKGTDRRHSAPIQTGEQNLAVFAAEHNGEGKVLTGLLASLAGVRSRSGSTPAVEEPLQVTLKTCVPSSSATTTSSSYTFSKVSSSSSSITSTSSSYTSGNMSSILSTTTTATTTTKTVPTSQNTISKISSTVTPGAPALSETSEKTPVAPVRRKSKGSRSPIDPGPAKLDFKLNHSKDSGSKSDVLGNLKIVDGKHMNNLKNAPVNDVSQKNKVVSTDVTKGKSDSKTVNKDSGMPKSILKPAVGDTKVSGTTNTKEKDQAKANGKVDMKKREDKGVDKSLLHSKTSGLSSSQGKLSQAGDKDAGGPLFSEIKLKRVMPEKKNAQIEPAKLAFDVKLNKVEEKEKSSSSSKATPKTSKSMVDSVMSGQDKVQQQQTSDKDDTKPKNDKSSSEEIPQWKKDIEERRKKLREDIAKSEAVRTPLRKEREQSEERKVRSHDNQRKVSNFNEDKNDSRKPVDAILNTHKDQDKQTNEKKDNELDRSKVDDKLNWQHEAEKRMAALVGFESDDDLREAKENTKPNQRTTPVPAQRNSRDILKMPALISSQEQQTQAADSMAASHKGPVLKSISEPEHQFSKMSTPKGKKKDSMADDQSVKKTEDFRDKLNNLKHVNADKDSERLKVNDDKVKDCVDLTKPHKLSNVNNNNKTTEDNNTKDGTSDKNHITKLLLSTSPHKDREMDEPVISPTDKIGRKRAPSPPRRKITVVGRNIKGQLESPPQTPVSRKKIEVGGLFDFDQSSESPGTTTTDMESSLSSSASQLTLDDVHTPPSRPPPPRHPLPSPGQISALELQQQLMEIDNRLTDLELRGRDLEDSIRNVSTPEDDDDELMIEWFKLISEKNDLVRQEADLVYISREQELEGEQEQIESQLRYLLTLPDVSKSPEEKQEEDYLIQRKVELVDQRDCIVNSMDEDRLRYLEEDRDIEVMLKGKGLWSDPRGTLKALKGKKVAKSKFYV